MTQAMADWNAYRIEPLQPLVFRSGRPFGTGAQADGANFPLPSAAAGLLRTLHGQGVAGGVARYDPDALAALAHKGPFLLRAEVIPQGVGPWTVCVPRPADAVYLADGDDGVRPVRLAPSSLPEGIGCDLPDGLWPVIMTEQRRDKPRPGPQWWTLPQWLDWQRDRVPTWGPAWRHAEPLVVQRVHVALDDQTRAARQGQLFRVESLDFGQRWPADGAPAYAWSFGVLGQSQVDDQTATFGGEGRLSAVVRCTDWPEGLREVPQPLLQHAAGKRGVALTLLTPAIFHRGWRPGWLDAQGVGSPPGCPQLRLALRAAAIERWMPVSGWDLASDKPKATRKAVAAGAVYWFELLEGDPVEALRALWLGVLSDDEEDRLQGFGVALAAPWQPAVGADKRLAQQGQPMTKGT